jgi:hypothetical protein
MGTKEQGTICCGGVLSPKSEGYLIMCNLAKLHITSANLALSGVFSYLMQYCALPSRSFFSIQKERWKPKLFSLVLRKVRNRNLANTAKDR